MAERLQTIKPIGDRVRSARQKGFSFVADATARRYAAVGLIVTISSYLVLYFLVLALHVGNIPANFAAVVFGLTLSFILNRKYAFRFEGGHTGAIARYIVVVVSAYLLNLAALTTLLRFGVLPGPIAQFLSVSLYTIVAYALHRLWTFRSQPAPNDVA